MQQFAVYIATPLYGNSQCYLPPGGSDNPAFTPNRSRYSIWRPPEIYKAEFTYALP